MDLIRPRNRECKSWCPGCKAPAPTQLYYDGATCPKCWQNVVPLVSVDEAQAALLARDVGTVGAFLLQAGAAMHALDHTTRQRDELRAALAKIRALAENA